MKFEKINLEYDYIPTYNFKYETIMGLKRYLLENVKWQEEAIESVINIFKLNMLRLNNKPISMLFSWASWVGKTLTTKLISEYFQNENYWWFKLYTIDLSSYFTNEVSSFLGTAPWFSWSDQKSLFENIAEIMYDSENVYSTIIIYMKEIDKLKVNSYEKNPLDTFFKTIFELLNEPIHAFKWNSKWTKHEFINLTNAIFIMDWNFINDEVKAIYKCKIWFFDENNDKIEREKFEENNKINKAKLVDYLKSKIPISAFNRLNYSPDSIIQFNDINESVYREIYNLEFSELIEWFLKNTKYKDKQKLLLKNNFVNKKEIFYNKMLETIDVNNW